MQQLCADSASDDTDVQGIKASLLLVVMVLMYTFMSEACISPTLCRVRSALQKYTSCSACILPEMHHRAIVSSIIQLQS